MRISGLDAVGHFVVAAEVRTAGSTGIWLRVMDGRKLLRRATWASWAPFGADQLGEVQVSSYSNATATAHVSMHMGRALVTLEDFVAVPGSTLFVVDLRPLLDDDAATTTAVPANIVQAQLAQGNLTGGVIRGNYAYVGNSTGLRVVDITAAMDELSATTVPAGALTATLPLVGGAEAVTAFGSFAYVSPTYGPSQGKGFQVVDIQTPLAPTVASYLPLAGTNQGCYARGSVLIAGSRAYISGSFRSEIFELE